MYVYMREPTPTGEGVGATETREVSHARELSCPNYLLDGSLYHLGRDGASTVHVFTYACTEIQ